jgi:hypothetical protein
VELVVDTGAEGFGFGRGGGETFCDFELGGIRTCLLGLWMSGGGAYFAEALETELFGAFLEAWG